MTFFSIIYNIIFILTVGLSLVKTVRHGVKNQNYLCLYLIATFYVELNSIIHIVWFSTTNTYQLYQNYALFCVLFFGYYYFRIIFHKFYKYIILLLILSAIASSVIMINFGVDFSFGLGMAVSVVYIFYALTWYYYVLKYNIETKITSIPDFWISSALLFWGSFYVLKAYPAQYLAEKDPSFHSVLKDINYIVATIMYGLIGIGILKFKKTESIK